MSHNTALTWYHTSWRGWFKTEEGGRSVLNNKLDFCILPTTAWPSLGQFPAWGRTSSWLLWTYNCIAHSAKWCRTGSDVPWFLLPHAGNGIGSDPWTKFVNGTSKLKEQQACFFRLEEKLMERSYNVMGTIKKLAYISWFCYICSE